jgi:hypothetical protein
VPVTDSKAPATIAAAALMLALALVLLQVALRGLNRIGGHELVSWFMEDHYTLWVPLAALIAGFAVLYRSARHSPQGEFALVAKVAIFFWALATVIFLPWVWVSRALLFVLDMIGGRELVWRFLEWNGVFYLCAGTAVIMAVATIMTEMAPHKTPSGS